MDYSWIGMYIQTDGQGYRFRCCIENLMTSSAVSLLWNLARLPALVIEAFICYSLWYCVYYRGAFSIVKKVTLVKNNIDYAAKIINTRRLTTRGMYVCMHSIPFYGRGGYLIPIHHISTLNLLLATFWLSKCLRLMGVSFWTQPIPKCIYLCGCCPPDCLEKE